MNVQKTYEAIVARIQERRRVIEENNGFNPTPWIIYDNACTALDANNTGVFGSKSDATARIVQAVNAEADMLGLCEKFARKAQADYRACEAVWKQTTGMEFVRLINDADAARDRLFLVARALRVEVVE
jgi:hypothetical protein